jgi:hypothetical protein
LSTTVIDALLKRRLVRPGTITDAPRSSPVALPPRAARTPRLTVSDIRVSSRGTGSADECTNADSFNLS